MIRKIFFYLLHFFVFYLKPLFEIYFTSWSLKENRRHIDTYGMMFLASSFISVPAMHSPDVSNTPFDCMLLLDISLMVSCLMRDW